MNLIYLIYNKKMSNISKQEIISNLKDKISQFKSNFSKNKESRKEVSDLNFEINRDALKLFYKNKQEGGEDGPNQEQQPKQQTKIEDIYDIKKILNENKPKSKSSSKNNLIKIEKEEKKINNIEQENKNNNIGAKIKTNFDFGGKEINNEEINKSERNIKISNNQQNEEKENKDIFIKKNNNENMNINPNVNANNFEKKSNFNFEYENYSKLNQNNNNNIKDNNNLGHITLNNSNYNDFSIDELIKNRKTEKEKRDKSAPKINLNQKINNNFYMEKPLTDKHNQNDINNIKNINYTTNYSTKNDFNAKKSNKTEELYQKLLVNFNINTKPNKKNTSFYNFNIKTNNNNNNIFNNYNYNTKENNPNKSYGQINIKDINLLYEINGNTNNYNQKKNYFRNELNLDHLKDLYSKKTEDNRRPTKGGLKSKMDLFYQELNEYKNSNNNKKQAFKNYFTNDKFLSNNKYIYNNSQYNNYIKNTNNKNLNLQNLNINEQNNINKNNGSSLSYNEIHSFKQYLKDLSKEEINNLPYNVKSELKDIFNILYQKFNE